MSDIERRHTPVTSGGIEIRETGIKGLAAVTRATTDIGPFTEEIAPGAFDEALARSDIRGLFNHDPNLVLGRAGKTMTVSAGPGGLSYDIPALPESRSDVREAIERGDVDGNSFSFSMPPNNDGETWTERDGKPHRTIERIQELFDVGPVTFPAYEDTTVSARSRDCAAEIQRDIDGTDAEPAPLTEEPHAELLDRIAVLERRMRLIESA